jgi:hypothetical protein
MISHLEDLTNLQFGKLKVIGPGEKPKNRKSNGKYWLCQCECGNKLCLLGAGLRKGTITSCGCFKKTQLLSRSRKAPGYSGLSKLLSSYKWNAKSKGLPFELTRNEFETLTSSDCYYCGSKPSSISKNTNATVEGIKHSEYLFNGIDRIDTKLGYILSNCVPCCERCNRAKYTFTQESFLQWVKRIYEKTFSN